MHAPTCVEGSCAPFGGGLGGLAWQSNLGALGGEKGHRHEVIVPPQIVCALAHAAGCRTWGGGARCRHSCAGRALATPRMSSQYRLQPHAALSQIGPNLRERTGSDFLKTLLDETNPVLSDSEVAHRQMVILALEGAVREWICEVAVLRGLFADKQSAAVCGGSVRISGSFRLHVAGPSADIDAICVAPRFVTRDDFFGTLPAFLGKTPGVTKVRPIPAAMVPLTEVEIDGVEVDLLFCRLEARSIPTEMDILNDLVLQGADMASVRSLNGPRVTELVVKLVNDFPTFQVVLRATRLWCKRRGLYSNKLGFLGGVNLAILCAFFCQLFPNMKPAGLLFRWFYYLSRWPWPKPIFITRPYERVDMTSPVAVWNPVKNPQHSRHLMPIITPAYPCDNSTYNVLMSTLSIMRREFRVSIAPPVSSAARGVFRSAACE
jgi:poly(A) polymerase